MNTYTADYEKIFNSLCHFMAISKSVDTHAVLENLVLSAIVFHDNKQPLMIEEIAEAMAVYFATSVPDDELTQAIENLCNSGRLHRVGGNRFSVTDAVKQEVSERARAANELEDRVRNEWFGEIEEGESIPLVDTNLDKNALWSALQRYMARSFRRHGVQTIQLLDPNTPNTDETNTRLSSLIEEALDEAGFEDHEARKVARISIRSFFQNQTADRVNYLAQLLDGTFSFFALNHDNVISDYLSGEMGPLKIFLDTNFIFGVLELHHNPLVDVSRQLMLIIEQYFPNIRLIYHPETLEEMRRTVSAIGEKLEEKRWQRALSRAALKNGQLSGLEMKYHEVNAQQPVDPDVFLNKYLHPDALLGDQGFSIYDKKYDVPVDEKGKLVADYKDFIENRRHPKPYKAYDHDVTVLLAARAERGSSRRSVLDSGAMLLTCDYYLYAFDQQAVQRTDRIGTAVLPNHLLQVLRPLMPASPDFDRRFVETFAIPEFRTIGSDYSATVSNVLGFLNAYADISEATASRILADELLIRELSGIDESSAEFAESIESALARDNSALLEEVVQKKDLIAELTSELSDQSKVVTEKTIKVDELTRRLAQLEKKEGERDASIEALTRKADEERERFNEWMKQADRRNLFWRASFSLILAILFSVVLFSDNMVSNWLEQQPRVLALRISALVIIWGLAAAVIITNHRKWILTAVVLAAILGGIRLL